MKKILLITIISILIPLSLSAQGTSTKKDVAGSWLGTLSADGMELRVVFNLTLVTPDSLSVTLDSPDQNAKDIPGGQVTLEMQKIVIQAPVINGEYSGTLTSDSTIVGTWSQNGGTLPLDLKKQARPK